MNILVIFRIIFFVTLAGVWYGGFWLLGGVLTLVYFFRYLGYELVVLGLFLDIHFMTGFVPWYTIAFAGTFIVIEWSKPRLLAYTS